MVFTEMATPKPFYYGGQAVIEGVMMRGRDNIAIAVRRPDGELDITSQPLASIYKGRLREIPLIRGIIILIETMGLGIKSLLHSARVASAEEEEEEISPAMLWGTVAIGIVLAVALFFVAPLLLTRYLISPHITSSLVVNIIEGVIRISMFIAYLKLIGLMSDIKAVFSYHGAEHKAVNAYEAGAPLELDSVKNYSTAHTRCGTSFLLAVMVVAVIVFAMLGQPPMWLSLLSRIILIPLIAAISYEFIRFGTAHNNNPVMRIFIGPGLALQAMTTREPNNSQLEAALAALNMVIETDSSSGVV